MNVQNIPISARKNFHRFLFYFSAILFFSIVLPFNTQASAESPQNGILKGTVTDASGEPIPGVNITLPELNRGTTTGADGTYQMQNLTTGTYTVVFSFVGFSNKNRTVTISSGEETTLNVTLEQQLIQSESITITGTPYATDPLDTPSDVDVVVGSEKFSSEKTSLGATIDGLAGITTIQTGSQAGKPVIRGLSGNRIRVLNNGTPMEFQQFGVRHPPNVDPLLSQRIEVVRGASSVQYGSDAIGGAVNVLSGQIPDALDRPDFLEGEVISEFAGNNSEAAGGLKLSGAREGLGFKGSIVVRGAGNMHTPDVPNFRESDDTEAPKFTDELDHTDFDQVNGSFGLGYKTDSWDFSSEFTHWQNDQNFLLPNGLGLGQYLQNDVLEAKLNIRPGNNWTITPAFTYNRNLRQSSPGGGNAIERDDLTDENLALDILRQTYTGKVKVAHPEISKVRGTIGLEYSYDDQGTFGPEPLVPAGEINTFALYLFENINLQNLTLSVGARLDRRTQEAEPNSELNLPDAASGETNDILEQDYTEFSGSFGANYRLTQHLAASANIGRGFRAPSFFDLHADGVHGGIAAFQIGNPELDSERSLNTDLSLKLRMPTLNAKATVYRNQIDNYIFLVNTGKFAGGGSGPPILRNIQNDALLYGFDISAHVQILDWLEAGGTFETIATENRDTGDELPLTPPTRTSVHARFVKSMLGPLENGFFRVELNHTASKDAAGRFEPFWQFGNAPQFSDFGVASTDAYLLVNASLGFDLPFQNQLVSVMLSAENLLDEDYRDFLNTYKGYALNPGRNIKAKIRVPFATN
ncbi:MAG: TonB-dependent receptor [Bacteroidetes bacterium]|jgi:iron complex outermembrane receptor protein/hemoglobin/transferrin/lactoferrin receptor protein|nr:TonB-dependent receptor [Bacteroidota bacterium]